MFGMMVNVLVIGLGLGSILLLADCGLRWWSAFGALRRELAWDGTVKGRIGIAEFSVLQQQGMRPATVHGGYSCFGRNPVSRSGARLCPVRAAA